MMIRAVVPIAFFAGLAFASALPSTTRAQETHTGVATAGQTAPPQPSDQTAARVKYLHDRLRITAEQEPHWGVVAQAIHDNAGDLAPLLKERFRTTTSGSALDLLHAYETLGEAQLGALKKIITALDPLYNGMSDSQKKIADAILREGAQNAMISGIPWVPPPVSPALVYPLFWGGLPLVVQRPLGFHHFRGLHSPGAHFGGVHR
jgi:LTXXQ motif family protein